MYNSKSIQRVNKHISPNGKIGFEFEEVILTPRIFANWGPDNIPPQIVKEALAKEISKLIEYDVLPMRDNVTGETQVKFSTSVYMKPDNIELNERVNKLSKDLLDAENEVRSLKLRVDDLVDMGKKSTNKYIEFSNLYYEKLGDWNTWDVCISRGMYLLWLNFKIGIYGVLKYFPRF